MPTADLILRNANVITVDTRQPAAQTVAVKDGKILFAGYSDDLSLFQGKGTRVIDCTGKTVMPGFIDAHCHIFSNIRKLLSVDLSGPEIKSINDIKQAIRKQAAKTPPEEWINATDYNDFTLAEKRHPTRQELDEVSPQNPVCLSHRSLHACVLNSKGLELAKIGNETPEPKGGFIGRDVTTGAPNGLLVEMLAYIREQVLPTISDAELDRGIKLANQQYLSMGLTSLGDATYVNDMHRWQRYQHFKANHLLESRVYMMCGIETIKEFQAAGMKWWQGDEHLRLGAMKIVPSLITDTLHPPKEDLVEKILAAHQGGFQVAIHAVQNKLIEAVVSAYEEVKKQASDFNIRRHRIEHCAECTPDLQTRIKALGLAVTTHPSFAYYSGDRYLATVEPEYIPHLYPLKALVNTGLNIAAASDSPVVNNNPIMGIYGGVNRLTASGKSLSPEQAVSAMDVLRMYTLSAAYQSHEEKIKGSITPGKLADIVVLSADPTRLPAALMKDIKVEMTIIGGKVVWQH
ncbi:MAG: amidohydrolase [Dehalococcoidales bacterium]|nr:amidohydrolase [Dehalococcoidales bacterium]